MGINFKNEKIEKCTYKMYTSLIYQTLKV